VSKKDATHTTAKYPAGKVISVYYSPESTETSCLEPGKYRNISPLSVVLGFTLLGVGISILAVNLLVPNPQRRRRKS
jgi:hypothetical protein